MPEGAPQIGSKNEASQASPMTPREIVSELDRYIVGQKAAKRAVAIALRNRWRRQQVAEDLRDEIAPKNIIMIGPTGVGKTEISRRLAKLAQAPFLKVEASKFTEVGYVGRDVESMIRDLAELAISMVKEEEKEKVQIRSRETSGPCVCARPAILSISSMKTMPDCSTRRMASFCATTMSTSLAASSWTRVSSASLTFMRDFLPCLGMRLENISLS